MTSISGMNELSSVASSPVGPDNVWFTEVIPANAKFGTLVSDPSSPRRWSEDAPLITFQNPAGPAPPLPGQGPAHPARAKSRFNDCPRPTAPADRTTAPTTR